MPRMTIELTQEEMQRLIDIAVAERRLPRDQAARFVMQAIRQHEALNNLFVVDERGEEYPERHAPQRQQCSTGG